jgi:ribose transport system ATP-binding protein
LIIFDEPTASLSESETLEVFRIVRELRRKGIGILYITHRLAELAEIADKVTTLRDGDTVYHSDYKDTSMDQIVHQMVGRKVERIYERQKLTPGKEVLKVDLLARSSAWPD